MIALEACHIDNERANDTIDNLVWLCQTHHVMLDCGMYPRDLIRALRNHWDDWFKNDRQPIPLSSIRDAAKRAGATRRKSSIARRAWTTRRAKQATPEDEG